MGGGRASGRGTQYVLAELLPHEVWLQVLARLDELSLIRFSRTCRAAHKLVVGTVLPRLYERERRTWAAQREAFLSRRATWDATREALDDDLAWELDEKLFDSFEKIGAGELYFPKNGGSEPTLSSICERIEQLCAMGAGTSLFPHHDYNLSLCEVIDDFVCYQLRRQYTWTTEDGIFSRRPCRLSDATWTPEDTTFLRIVEVLIAAGGDALSLSRAYAGQGGCSIVMRTLGRTPTFRGPLEVLETIVPSAHPPLSDLQLPFWTKDGNGHGFHDSAERMSRVRRLLRLVLHHALLETGRTVEDSAEWEKACAEWETANYVEGNPLYWWDYLLRDAQRICYLQHMDVLQSVLHPARHKRIFLRIFFEVHRLGDKTIATSLYHLVDWVYRHHNASGMAALEHANTGLVSEEAVPSPSVRLAFALARRKERRWLFWVMSWVPDGELELWRNAEENGNTLLHVACDCRGRSERVVAGLVERGWDVWRRNDEGMTALDLVRRRRNHRAEAWLLAWFSQTQTTPCARAKPGG